MSDEFAASQEGQAVESASQQGTGAQEAQESTQTQQFTEQDYKALQAEYTRSQQQNKQFEQAFQQLTDPETQAEALKQYLGLELALEQAEQELEEEYAADPTEELRRELAELKGWRDEVTQSQQAEQQTAQEATFIDQRLTELEEQHGVKLTDEQAQVIAGLAFANRDARGVPNVDASWALFQSASPAQVKQATRKAAQVPGGQTAVEQPDVSTHEKRMADYAAKLQALEQ